MITKLLKFLLIQMTIHFALAANLEGRTSHYVNLLDSNANDDTALRITCPVYTIRPANKTAKFIKYAASAEQFAVIDDWEDRTNATTFQACANQAATEDVKMFMFDDGACTVSNTLFIRLPETCEDESAVIVYMVEPHEGSCADEYTWIDEGPIGDAVYCVPFDISLTCSNGKIYGYDTINDVVYFRTEKGCYSIFLYTAISYDTYQVECSARLLTTCTPDDADSRAEFVQILKVIAVDRGPATGFTDFMVDCRYDSGLGKFGWIAGISTIDQPENIDGEWKNGFPANQASAEYVYMTPEGLMNGGDASSDYYCCYEANTNT